MINDVEEQITEETSKPSFSERVRSLINAGKSKQLMDENRDPTEEEIQELREAIGEAYEAATIQLAEEEDESEEVTNLLLSANKKLSSKRKITMDTFLKAEKDFKKAYVILERVKKVRKANRSPRWAVVFVAVAYPIIIFVIGLFPLPDRVLGLPTLVFAWGFFGGYAAVVFRHLLLVGEKWKFEFVWLWVIIRPFLGAIMGAFLYLALISGVLLFSSQIILEEIREQLILFIAFVGGFSEKFWETMITAVLGPARRSNSNQTGEN